MRIEIGGATINLLQQEEVLTRVRAALQGKAGQLAIGSVNLDHIYKFVPDTRQAKITATSEGIDWLWLADGMPVVWRIRRATRRCWPQLAGANLLEPLLLEASATRSRVGFLGGTGDQHSALRQAFASSHPNLLVAGYWAPERVDVEDRIGSARLASQIADAGVDLLVVSLGKPLQERWIDVHMAPSGARVALAFGAAADFLAGTRKRAPECISRIGLEWLYRLCLEPRRLWRRYLVQAPVALYRLVRQPLRLLP
jgi:N-acetylglucosaminyldiphosphoundecaprenol N-acetyl-beta-D-mannosaminyltransferase